MDRKAGNGCRMPQKWAYFLFQNLKKDISCDSINHEEGRFNEMFIFGVRVEDAQIGRVWKREIEDDCEDGLGT